MPLSQQFLPSILSSWGLIILTLGAAGLAGLTAGLLYRVAAAIALSFVGASAGFLLCYHQGAGFWHSLLYAFGLITILQIGYLFGASISVTLSRAKAKLSMRSLIDSVFKQKTAP